MTKHTPNIGEYTRTYVQYQMCFLSFLVGYPNKTVYTYIYSDKKLAEVFCRWVACAIATIQHDDFMASLDIFVYEIIHINDGYYL